MTAESGVDSGNMAVVRELYRAFAAKDNDAVRAVMAPDVEWIQMAGFPGGGRHTGPDAVFAHVFAGFREKWDPWIATIDGFLDAGDDIVALGRYEGTFRATGRSFRAEFAGRYTLRGGRVTRFEQFTDTLLIARAMGLAG